MLVLVPLVSYQSGLAIQAGLLCRQLKEIVTVLRRTKEG